jgi:transposase
MQADAYAGFNRLYEATRKGGPIIEAACWAHGRRKFFDLARLQKAPIAIEAVERIDALFAIEREINGLAPEQRLAVRNERSRPLVVELETWLGQQRATLSRRSETAKAIDYSLKRWTAFTRFLDDGRLCMSNNAAERAVRCVAVGRKNWTFAGSDEGGHRAAAIYTLIETALCRRRHRQVYAVRRTMPSCPGLSRRCPGVAARRANSASVPFGIVWSLRAPPGRRASGRWGGSGSACHAHTA